MDTELLTQALEGDTELFKEILEHFPLELIQDEVSVLSEGYQAKFRELEDQWRRQQNAICNPDNPYYDLSILKDGQRVTSFLEPERGIGTVEIKKSLVFVHFDCGITDCYYPNQLARA